MTNLLDVIATGAARLFTDEDLDVYCHDGLDEYLCASKGYNDFRYHTMVAASSISLDEFRPKHLKVLSYLKRKFFEDLAKADKIYVRKGADSIVDLRKLHRALKAYGINSLLCVYEADEFHAPGTVETIDAGLWRGYISRFKRFDREEPVDLANWLRVLSTVHHKRHPSSRLARTRLVATGHDWVLANRVVETVPGRTPARNDAAGLRLALRATISREDHLALREIPFAGEPETILVFSAWIEVGHDFRGHWIGADVIGATVLHRQPADLSKRELRQRLWVVARSPSGRTCTLAIRASADLGSILVLGGWSVETGAMPGPEKRLPTLIEARRSMRRVGASCFRHARRRTAADQMRHAVRDASAAMARGAFIEADDRLALALAEAPDNVEMLKLYAFSAHNSARYVAAIERWRRAIQAAPRDPMCRAGIAANFREIGEVGCAANEIGSALALFPDDGIILTEAARIAQAQGQAGRALDLWEKAVALHGSIPELLTARDQAKVEVDRQARDHGPA